MVLEEIAPEDKTRNEGLGARVNLYMAAKKWEMAAAVASHLVKVDPGTAGWWISLAYALASTSARVHNLLGVSSIFVFARSKLGIFSAFSGTLIRRIIRKLP